MRIVILDSFAADQGDDTMWSGLRALGELVVHGRSADGDVVARAAGAVAALTNKVAFSANEFAALPDLRYVGVLATGTNIVDPRAARGGSPSPTSQLRAAVGRPARARAGAALSQDVAGHAAASRRRLGGVPSFCFTRRMFGLDGKTLVLPAAAPSAAPW
jgi:hypothetical protein